MEKVAAGPCPSVALNKAAHGLRTKSIETDGTFVKILSDSLRGVHYFRLTLRRGYRLAAHRKSHLSLNVSACLPLPLLLLLLAAAAVAASAPVAAAGNSGLFQNPQNDYHDR